MRALKLFLLLLLGSGSAQAEQCQMDNAALQSMSKVQLVFTLTDKSVHAVEAKLADSDVTRAAGFQYVCAAVIAAEPILFLFQRARVPSFHMHNVVAPIDIAFIKEDGSIDSFHSMLPYSMIMLEKPLYSSREPVIAALEVAPGYFKEHGINAQATVTWQPLPDASDLERKAQQ